MGFTLLANFLFCVGLMALALLHLRALITISRIETRTLQLVQELAMLEEKLGRAPEAR
jgi:Tfp pilus assembly protein PilV